MSAKTPKNAKKILTPNLFSQERPPPYHHILNADYPPGLSPKQLTQEVKRRNETVRFAKSIELEILRALEEGRLPEFEKRVAGLTTVVYLDDLEDPEDIVESKTKRPRKAKKPKRAR